MIAMLVAMMTGQRHLLKAFCLVFHNVLMSDYMILKKGISQGKKDDSALLREKEDDDDC